MRRLPPLDVHAHLSPTISEADLQDLDAVVVAVTRSASEWRSVEPRRDATTIWALGLHPRNALGYGGSGQQEFLDDMHAATVIGEIGLDSRSAVPSHVQRDFVEQVFSRLSRRPQLASVHSVGCTREMADLIATQTPRGVILHWWRGNEPETRAALNSGCYFSINSAMANQPWLLQYIPRDRILTETDFPFTQATEHGAHRPGEVMVAEDLLADAWGMERPLVREQVWRSFADLMVSCSVVDRMPMGIRRYLLAAL